MTGREMALRLLISAVFGTLVGIERQWRHKNAGLKTNALVSIGATSFGLIALGTFGANGNPTQIAAGVVTGIGFIGAGVIMHRGASLQGINSAATVWSSAGMGLAIGQGSYQLGTYILITVLLAQVSLHWATNLINKRSGLGARDCEYRLSIGFKPASATEVRKVWEQFVGEPGVSVRSYRELRNEGEYAIDAAFTLSEDRANEANTLGQIFAALPGIVYIHCQLAPSTNAVASVFG